MSTGDVDQVGDDDIILGSFSFSSTPVPEMFIKAWQKGSPFIVLRNNLY
jgi:hypothetical protein